MKEYAAQCVLKGMVDRLETSEAGEPSPEFRRGAIACAASRQSPPMSKTSAKATR
jgi:hypothetical protein